MATSEYFAALRQTPLSEEEVKKWRSVTKEEWTRIWYEEFVPADQRPQWPNNQRPIEADKFPCHGEWIKVQARDGYEIPVLVYKPKKKYDEKRPVYFQIHGGGMSTGHPLTNDYECTLYNEELDILVINADYRLAPEHPYPVGIHDCYDVIKYFHDYADEWNIDVNSMGVGGCSSGGEFSIIMCFMAAMEKEFSFKYLMLLYPGVDTYQIPQTSDEAIEAHLMYNNIYLDDLEKRKDDPLANPLGGATDELLAQMPYTMMLNGGADWLGYYAKEFADRMMLNGVKMSYWNVPGAVHAFTIHHEGNWDAERAPGAYEFILENFRDHLMK